MTKVFCTCGQSLGRFQGKYDIRCHKCKRIMTGDTAAAIEVSMIRPPKLPRNMMPVR